MFVWISKKKYPEKRIKKREKLKIVVYEFSFIKLIVFRIPHIHLIIFDMNDAFWYANVFKKY